MKQANHIWERNHHRSIKNIFKGEGWSTEIRNPKLPVLSVLKLFEIAIRRNFKTISAQRCRKGNATIVAEIVVGSLLQQLSKAWFECTRHWHNAKIFAKIPLKTLNFLLDHPKSNGTAILCLLISTFTSRFATICEFWSILFLLNTISYSYELMNCFKHTVS